MRFNPNNFEANNLSVIHLDTVDSTSQYLKQVLANRSVHLPTLCVADKQTAGYGQVGKVWQTNSESLSFSFAIPVASNFYPSGALSLQLGCLLHGLLKDFVLPGQSVFVKWPNDVFVDNLKALGQLIEIVSHQHGKYIVIGVGINRIAPPASQFGAFVGFDGHKFLQRFCVAVLNLLDEYSTGLSADFIALWESIDYFKVGEKVFVYDTDQRRNGTYQGIAADGSVQVLIDDKLVQFHSGQVSIRKI